ncbi:hypothetical protein JW933_02065 [candidate division FCPU426 bacterium]|nr:hypothetical protein [candidate division FCPU426 bacterium]
MADPNTYHVAAGDETLVIHRGVVVLASLLMGMGIAYAALQLFRAEPMGAEGIVGVLSMGRIAAFARLGAILVLAGATAGALIGYRLWLLLSRLQHMVGHVSVAVALKRAAVPFGVFLPQMTSLVQGRVQVVLPLSVFAGLAAGFLLLAWLESRDKRKIFFAHPTESDYQPLTLFTHGGVITLGTGVGWFVQSLPQLNPAAGVLGWGLWFALGVGVLLWIGSLLLAGLLSLFFRKQTFDQVFLSVALSLLPLAVLPLQTAGVLHYWDGKKAVGGREAPLLPLLLGAAALVGGLGLLVVNLLRLKQQTAEVNPEGEELFRALLLIVAVPLLLYAAAFWPAGAPYTQHKLIGAVDLFQEGEGLSAAQAMLMGRLPFKEILLRHGFLTDIAGPMIAMQWFGISVEAYRMLMVLLAPLGLVALYLLAIFCLPWLWALVVTFTVLTGHLGTIPATRFFFPVISYIFTLYFIQRNQWPILVFSGLLTALSLISSFAAGMLALSGQSVLLLGFLFFGQENWRNRIVQVVIFFGVVLLGLAPWWLYLGMSGSLGAYFSNFTWVLSNYTPIFGLPLPSLGEQSGIIRILQFALPPAAVVLGVLAMANALRQIRQTGFFPWNVLVLAVLTAFFWIRFLSRSQPEFLSDVLPVAAMLLAFFIYRLSARQQLLRGIMLAAFLPALFIPQSGTMTLPEIAGGFGKKNQLPVEGLTACKSERLYQTYLPAAQARDLDQMVAYLEEQVGTAETYFDFSNQPLLYFLAPRRPAVQSPSTAGLATFSQQIQAIHDLEHSQVKAVLFQGQPLGHTMLDNIPSILRQYAMAEYLLQRYIPVKSIGPWVVFAPPLKDLQPDPKAVAALQAPLALYSLPWQWGAAGKYNSTQGNVVSRYVAADGVRSVAPAGITVTAQGDALAIGNFPQPVQLHLTLREADAPAGNVLVVQFRAQEHLDGQTAHLYWGQGEGMNQVDFTIQGDNQSHPYVFRVKSWPGWVYAPDSKHIGLQLPGGGWTWEAAMMLQVQDIPELARPAGKAKEN